MNPLKRKSETELLMASLREDESQIMKQAKGRRLNKELPKK